MSTTLSLSAAGCTAAGADPEQFIYGFAQSTLDGFNSLSLCTVDNNCIQLGDVSNIVPSGACFSSRRLRALLQASAAVSSRVNVPPGVSREQATAATGALQAALVSSLTTGTFANQFGITGASVTVSDPVTTDSSDNSLALGLGLGLGLGIPVVIAIIAAVVIVSKRRKNQTVGQSSVTAAESSA